MSAPQSVNSNWKAVLCLGGGGLLMAGIFCVLGLLLTGLGHGWTSTIGPSQFSLVIFPVLGIGAAMRSSQQRLLLAAALALAAIMCDFALILSTVNEGTEYFRRALNALPLVGLSWLAIWIGAQALAVGICVVTARDLRRNPAD